jgi:hypothetical protein
MDEVASESDRASSPLRNSPTNPDNVSESASTDDKIKEEVAPETGQDKEDSVLLLPPSAVHNRFSDVIRACLVEVEVGQESARAEPPRCHSSLEAVEEEDVVAFKRDHPECFAALEKRVMDGAAALENERNYRAIGLYVALLAQGIDLSAVGYDGPMACNEALYRISAVLKTSMSAMKGDNRTSRYLLVGLVAISGLILLLIVGVIVLIVART